MSAYSIVIYHDTAIKIIFGGVRFLRTKQHEHVKPIYERNPHSPGICFQSFIIDFYCNIYCCIM